MSNKIRILHITDCHICDKSVPQIKQRVQSLTKYLNLTRVEVDLVVFTGDLTYSGTKSEFELFEEIVAKPIKSQLRIHDSKFLFIPGNHDVNRKSINISDHGRLRKLGTPSEAEAELEKINDPWARLSEYLEYASNHAPTSPAYDHHEFCNGLYSTRRINNLKGINLGFALFNSAWLCADDQDHEKLFISEKQIRDAVDSLRSCDLRIALVHHPKEWYHPSELDLSLNDLRREFSLILTGHLHKPISVSEIDTCAHSISLSARALFDGKKISQVDDGFHLYEISISDRKIGVFFRKYIRKRDTFDKDTDHADDGFHEYELPVPMSLKNSTTLIVHRLSGECGLLATEVRKTLALLQGTENPVFVIPKLRSFKVKNGVRKTIESNLSIDSILEQNTVITGERDCGKTILLKTIASGENLDLGSTNGKRAFVYIPQFDAESWESKEELIELIKTRVSGDIDEIRGMHLSVLMDGLSKKQSERLLTLHETCTEFGWTYLTAMRGYGIDVLAQKDEFTDVMFAEVRPWGPSRIREFTSKIFEGTKINSDMAYKSICRCMRSIDMPANPTIISLYVSVFAMVGSQISTLSFLRVLEKIEQIKLGQHEVGTVQSLYNRQKILTLFAIKCLDDSTISISILDAVTIINGHFKPKKLTAEPETFLQDLIDSGFIKREESEIAFSNYVFFDYYLAIAFRDGLVDHEHYTNEVRKCARVASALSLFAGMRRENEELAVKLMATVENSFTSMSEMQLCDLDKHINGLLVTESRKASDVDKVAQEALDQQEDEEAIDAEYEAQRKVAASNRQQLMENGLDKSIGDLSLKIEGLHSFYSVFRNLENIKGTVKEELLDKILNYHIATNFFLIDFYFSFSTDKSFRTYAAYSLTWGGHGFMTSSLGNPSMCDAIFEVVGKAQNDFKKFLLILLLSELGDDRATDLIESFIGTSDSRAATEIFFLHVRNRLIEHQRRELPVGLISVFKKIFIKRQTKFGGAKSGAEATNAFDGVLREVRKEHWKHFREADPTVIAVGESDNVIDV